MTSDSIPRRSPGLHALRVLAWGLVGLGVALALIAFLAFSDAPSVADPGPPDAEAVAEARALARTMRDFVTSDAARGTLTFDEGEVGAALASVRRVLPGLLGRFAIEGDEARMELSTGGPTIPGGRWINAGLGVRGSAQGLEVVSAHVGRVALPPALVLPVARFALDRFLGEGLGSEALDSVSAVEIDGSQMAVSFAFPEGEDTATFFERLRARLHVIAGSDDAQRVHTHLWYLHERGFEAGGELVPYLRHVVETARRLSDGDDRSELESAFFALALYCGDELLGDAAGIRLGARHREENFCRSVALRKREDLRKHFTISAGLYAMRSDATVLGVGEIKELLDSNAGGSGFSLDDMAANAAGVRFAAEFLEAPSSEWPDMLGYVRTDEDILPPLDGLDSGMTAEEFQSRYGDVDTLTYRSVIAEIERRIDALPLYARNRLN